MADERTTAEKLESRIKYAEDAADLRPEQRAGDPLRELAAALVKFQTDMPGWRDCDAARNCMCIPCICGRTLAEAITSLGGHPGPPDSIEEKR